MLRLNRLRLFLALALLLHIQELGAIPKAITRSVSHETQGNGSQSWTSHSADTSSRRLRQSQAEGKQKIASEKKTPGKQKSIAIVGGGIAGATIALELLSHPDKPDVTLFEAHGGIGHTKSASGIIAASFMFNAQSQYWKFGDDTETIISNLEKIQKLVKKPTMRQLHFAARAARYKMQKDKRFEKSYNQKYFEASRKRLEHIVDLYPDLCGVVIGPYCCRAGSKARTWMDANGDGCGLKPIGWGHVFLDVDDWKTIGSDDRAVDAGWKIGGKGTDRYNDVKEFLMEEELGGVLWNDIDEGFVRVEELFPMLKKIFDDSGRVTVMPNCKVQAISSSNGLQIKFADGSTKCGDSAQTFDNVIVSAGANSVNVLATQDGVMTEEMIPIKGFACETNTALIKTGLRNMGLTPEEFAHQIRPKKNGGIRYNFGKVFEDLDDEVKNIDPQFEEAYLDKRSSISATRLGRKVLNQSDVTKRAGLRPVSAMGTFPLIKTYPAHKGLILATGMGFHGYVTSWKTAELVACITMTGKVCGDWEDAAEEYSGCSIYSLACWAWYHWLLAGLVVLLLCACCVGSVRAISGSSYKALGQGDQE